MYLIVGLGNPGKQYENTRHNVGFDAVDLLVDEYRVPSSGKQHKAMYGKGVIAGQKVILAKPLTYMNLSGESVRALVDYYKIDPEEELIVIYDDISLEPGKIRINIIVNLLPDGISAIESLAGMFRLSMNEFVVSNLALFITKVFDIIKNLLFLALGMSALKQRTIVIAPIERLVDKCMGMM